MKTYYCVATTIRDNAPVISHIVETIEADKKPESTMKETSRYDYYTDWFESLEEAEEFVRISKLA